MRFGEDEGAQIQDEGEFERAQAIDHNEVTDSSGGTDDLLALKSARGFAQISTPGFIIKQQPWHQQPDGIRYWLAEHQFLPQVLWTEREAIPSGEQRKIATIGPDGF
ncbi:hypothetical protein QQS21_004918, partial [Conoideocrella luteorostrata]